MKTITKKQLKEEIRRVMNEDTIFEHAHTVGEFIDELGKYDRSTIIQIAKTINDNGIIDKGTRFIMIGVAKESSQLVITLRSV